MPSVFVAQPQLKFKSATDASLVTLGNLPENGFTVRLFHYLHNSLSPC
jgi:hypothetical protein